MGFFSLQTIVLPLLKGDQVALSWNRKEKLTNQNHNTNLRRLLNSDNGNFFDEKNQNMPPGLPGWGLVLARAQPWACVSEVFLEGCQPPLRQNTLWGARTCCWPRIGYNCVASPFSVSFSRLKTPLKITKQREQVLWGREDVAKWIEHTHPSVSQAWAKMVHAFTTRKQTAGFYNWNVGLSSHLSKSEALELGDKMNIMILQPICPLQLQFFMTSIQSVN